jgi:SAM-dependent methyltransferase
MDEWGVGSYEDTAAELAPAAEVAVEALRVSPGERVLDVACGTGNAAAVAADRGAAVTGLDGSPRLLSVARERNPSGEFVEGDAADLPFGDGAFDAAVSVFGVIFARPAQRAAAEIARVVRPRGRLAITAWVPRGPFFKPILLMRQAIARVRPPDGSTPVDWSDRDTLNRLLGAYGKLELSEQLLRGAPASAESVWDRWERLHPMWIAARKLLEPVNEWDGLREATIAALREAGVEREVASPYLLITLDRS